MLNYAFESDTVPSDAAWHKVKPFRNVDRPPDNDGEPQASAGAPWEALRLAGRARKGNALLPDCASANWSRCALTIIDISGLRIRIHGNGDRQRFVPLNAEGRAFFAGEIKGKPADTLALPSIADDPVVNRVAVARGMKAASKELGITPRLTFHHLRRSWDSLMLNAGAPLEVIQQVLGHADTRMTRRTYAHLLQETVAEQIEQHLPSFTGKPKLRKRSRAAGRQR